VARGRDLSPMRAVPQGLRTDCAKAKLSRYTVDGTFSRYVVSYVAHVTRIPENFDSHEAAIFSAQVSLVTVYRALSDWIVLPGAGGGQGHLAVRTCV